MRKGKPAIGSRGRRALPERLDVRLGLSEVSTYSQNECLFDQEHDQEHEYEAAHRPLPSAFIAVCRDRCKRGIRMSSMKAKTAILIALVGIG